LLRVSVNDQLWAFRFIVRSEFKKKRSTLEFRILFVWFIYIYESIDALRSVTNSAENDSACHFACVICWFCLHLGWFSNAS